MTDPEIYHRSLLAVSSRTHFKNGLLCVFLFLLLARVSNRSLPGGLDLYSYGTSGGVYNMQVFSKSSCIPPSIHKHTELDTMSNLSSFNPFATHPFTNNSGLAPQPPRPSKYPHPIPSPSHLVAPQTSSPYVKSPQPQRGAGNPGNAPTKPIFVPFRQDNSSPELGDILSKNRSPSSLQSNLSTMSGKSS